MSHDARAAVCIGSDGTVMSTDKSGNTPAAFGRKKLSIQGAGEVG